MYIQHNTIRMIFARKRMLTHNRHCENRIVTYVMNGENGMLPHTLLIQNVFCRIFKNV